MILNSSPFRARACFHSLYRRIVPSVASTAASASATADIAIAASSLAFNLPFFSALLFTFCLVHCHFHLLISWQWLILCLMLRTLAGFSLKYVGNIRETNAQDPIQNANLHIRQPMSKSRVVASLLATILSRYFTFPSYSFPFPPCISFSLPPSPLFDQLKFGAKKCKQTSTARCMISSIGRLGGHFAPRESLRCRFIVAKLCK